MKTYSLVGMAVAVVITLAAGAAAESTSFRCGNTLIGIGETMYMVRQACGDPVFEQHIGERTVYSILEDERLKIKDSMYLTEWIYKKDSGTYILTFEGSRLAQKRFER